MAKVLSNEEHNAKVNEKIKGYQDKIDDLKKDLKEVSPVKQASLAECNALSKVKLKPKAAAVKLKSPQAIPVTQGEQAPNTLDYSAE